MFTLICQSITWQILANAPSTKRPLFRHLLRLRNEINLARYATLLQITIRLVTPLNKNSSHCDYTTHESGNLPNPHPCALHLHIRLVKRRRFSKVKSRWAGRVGSISLIFLAAARMNWAVLLVLLTPEKKFFHGIFQFLDMKLLLKWDLGNCSRGGFKK